MNKSKSISNDKKPATQPKHKKQRASKSASDKKPVVEEKKIVEQKTVEQKKSKFSRDDKKRMVESIENLKNDEDYVAIFEILMDDGSISCTPNSNGVFLNLSSASDDTLGRIKKYLKRIKSKNVGQIEIDVDIIPSIINTKNDRAYKLSNYEKNILKQRNLKKVLNEDNEYEELRFTAKNKSLVQNKIN